VAADEGASIETNRQKIETRIWLQILALENAVFSRLNGALLGGFGLSVAKFEFLAQVDRYPEGVSLGQISSNLKVSSGNVSGLVRRLLADDLITKTMSPDDRRSFIVRFTPKGRDVFAEANRVHAATLSACFGDISNDDLEQSLARLRSLNARVKGQHHD
jgi:DNA-binding MarR family transcriptional regulator